jgi:ribosomal protein S18 acetylase RimI-like enzyme
VNRVGESGAQPHTEKDFKTKQHNRKRPSMTSDKLTIRQATPKDWKKILPLFTQLYHGDIGPDLKKVFTTLTTSKKNSVLIAEQNEKAVGALIGSYYLDIDWEGKIAKLQAIIVDKKHQGKGIGKKLFHHFQTQAKGNNCRAITARVNRKNKQARGFYEKLNLEEAETNEYILEL